jgi:hypothetical protein
MNGVTSYRGTTFSERVVGAPCLETDPELGYPSQGGHRGKGKELAWLDAQAVCAHCPFELKQECLEVALKAEGSTGAGSRHGVFGGLDPRDRAALAKERNAARAKSPHAADHGTAARARAHRRDGETPCGPCLNGESATWQRRPRKRVAA